MEPVLVRPSMKAEYAAFFLAGVLMLGAALAGFNVHPGWYVLFAAAVVVDAWAAFSLIRKRFTKMTIESGRLRYEAGLLARTSRTLELSRVQDVRCDQTLGQRLIGVGDLTIETASENGRLVMPGIDQPQHVAERILDLARHAVGPHL